MPMVREAKIIAFKVGDVEPMTTLQLVFQSYSFSSNTGPHHGQNLPLSPHTKIAEPVLHTETSTGRGKSSPMPQQDAGAFAAVVPLLDKKGWPQWIYIISDPQTQLQLLL